MKQPTFFEGVAVAFAVSISGSALYAALTAVFPDGLVARLLIAGIGLAYLLYLLSRTRERVGRITMFAVWGVAAGLTWFLAPSPALYLLLHVGLIWLARSLYFCSSALCVIADLGLNGLSLATAIWAALQSGSVFLSLWSFFLVQALFVAIPPLSRKTSEWQPEGDEEDRFQRAHRVAETALHKISSIR